MACSLDWAAPGHFELTNHRGVADFQGLIRRTSHSQVLSRGIEKHLRLKSLQQEDWIWLAGSLEGVVPFWRGVCFLVDNCVSLWSRAFIPSVEDSAFVPERLGVAMLPQVVRLWTNDALQTCAREHFCVRLWQRVFLFLFVLCSSQLLEDMMAWGRRRPLSRRLFPAFCRQWSQANLISARFERNLWQRQNLQELFVRQKHFFLKNKKTDHCGRC